MEYTIGFDRCKVLREVNRITAFTARQIEGRFDRIAATTDEERTVLTYLNHALTEMAAKLAAFSPILSDEALSFDLPVTFNRLLEPALEKAFTNYLVNEICARWFHVTKPDETSYAQAGNVLFLDIQNLLCSRNKPIER